MRPRGNRAISAIEIVAGDECAVLEHAVDHAELARHLVGIAINGVGDLVGGELAEVQSLAAKRPKRRRPETSTTEWLQSAWLCH